MKEYVVFFDLDHTIFDVNSGRILIEQAHKKRLIHNRQIFFAYLFSAFYKIGILKAEYIMKKLAVWLKGISEKEFANFATEVFDKYLKNTVRIKAHEELKIHKKNNAHAVILSAATPYICNPVKDLLAFDDILCSKMEVNDGAFTGNPDGSYCYGEEKLNQVIEYCTRNNYDLQQAYYYADSYSDILVLKSVGNPICVTPDAKLKKIAQIKGWPIYLW